MIDGNDSSDLGFIRVNPWLISLRFLETHVAAALRKKVATDQHE
jgi:hypothetical protein